MGMSAIRRSVAVVCVIVLAAATSCSTSTGTGAGNEAAADPVETATTRALEPVDQAQLEGMLPDVEDIGSGYRVVPEGEPIAAAPPPAAWDEAVQEACPDLTDMTTGAAEVITVAFGRTTATAARDFSDPYFRDVGVLLTTDDDVLPIRDRRDALIGAINRCDIIRVPGSGDVPDLSVRLKANPDSNYGDVGMVMQTELTLSGGALLGEARGTGHVRAFQYGAVTAVIMTGDGVDPATGRRVRVDKALAPDLAQLLNRRIRDAQDG